MQHLKQHEKTVPLSTEIVSESHIIWAFKFSLANLLLYYVCSLYVWIMYVLNTCFEEAYRITRFGFIKISHSPILTAISVVRPSHHNKENFQNNNNPAPKNIQTSKLPHKAKDILWSYGSNHTSSFSWAKHILMSGNWCACKISNSFEKLAFHHMFLSFKTLP